MFKPELTLVGNLVADPELRYVGSGTPVASFTVASTPRSKNPRTGEYEDGEPLFIRCSAWREMAENVTESLSKGTRVVVTGDLTRETYQRDDGSAGEVFKLDVKGIGPDLRYATAEVHRNQRKSSTAPVAQGFNPWETQEAPF